MEVRGKDGKRRIQPIFLGSTVTVEPEAPPQSTDVGGAVPRPPTDGQTVTLTGAYS